MLKKLLLLLVALPILLKVTSCSSNCETKIIHWVDRGGGIINDSLFISNISVVEEEYCMPLGMGGRGSRKDGGCKLILGDIRFKKIYWEKKILGKECNHVSINSIQDSILIFESDDVNKIAFLKLGDKDFQQTKQIEVKTKAIKIEDESWKKDFKVRIRPWQNGLMLMNSKKLEGKGHGNYYALLDTAANIMEPWEPSGEFEWLNECSDAKWSLVGGLCLKEMADTLGFVLLKNGIDTLAVRYMPHKLPIEGYERENRPLIFSGNSIISRGWIYLMSVSRQVSEKPLDVWVSQMGVFGDLHGNETSYIYFEYKYR